MRTQNPASPTVPDQTEVKVIRHLRTRGFRYLHLVDSISLFVLMILITIARFGLDWPTFPRSHYFVGFAVATGIHVVVYYFGGMYQYEPRLGVPPWLPKVTLLTSIAVLSSAAVGLATGRYLMPRGNLVALLVLATAVVGLNRRIARRLRFRRFGSPRILLVGAPDDISLAREHLAESGRETTVAGQVADTAHLLDTVNRVGATDVLLLSGGSLSEVYPHPLEELESRKIGVFHRLSPSDTLLGLQRSRQIAGMPFVALHTHAVPPYRLRLKRLLDLAVLLLLALPILVVVASVALYVRVRVGKGIFYRQERVGRQGSRFMLVKFRTMYPDAEEATGAVLAGADDDRVVPGMGWLRASRLDELPQLWNVLKGEMSIVGPRPERPEFVARFEEIIPGYGRRHDMPPGITGMAQIRGHYQTDPGYKLGHDLQYVVNWSPVLDLQIMAETILVMLRRSAR